MNQPIYRTSLSAWRRLSEIGAIELEGRDADLAYQLKMQIDPAAPDLDTALHSTPTDLFVQAFFQVIQPFVMMFRDILDFFARAGEREGQLQWRISIRNTIVELREFEEFLKHWTEIRCLIDVPALSTTSAWIPYNLLRSDYFTHIFSSFPAVSGTNTGISDIDLWLSEYESGRYTKFPTSLNPGALTRGLDDAASVAVAALDILGSHRLHTRQSIREYWTQCHDADSAHDAFHPCSIALNESDRWLGTCVRLMSHLLTRSARDQAAFGDALAQLYGRFPRRQIRAELRIEELERLLSLPAWKKRHQTYAVWVATEMVEGLSDHKVSINHLNGELRFGFSEATIAVVESTRPRVSLISERQTPLANPVGRGRSRSVQPDFGLWKEATPLEECNLVVEVKHHKKRSRANFRDALVDYATAHHNAKVLLVNYGPVGEAFDDLPHGIRARCEMLGYLHPQNGVAREAFQSEVRGCVGPPLLEVSNESALSEPEAVAIDVSLSMNGVLNSHWFAKFLSDLGDAAAEFVLVDDSVRDTVPAQGFAEWRVRNRLQPHTALGDPVRQMLRSHASVLVVTDQEGFDTLARINARIEYCTPRGAPDVMLVQVSRTTDDTR